MAANEKVKLSSPRPIKNTDQDLPLTTDLPHHQQSWEWAENNKHIQATN